MAANELFIYFAASIRAGRGDASIYSRFVDILKKHGNVLTEHVGSSQMGVEGESHLSEKEIHDRDLEWLMQSDVLMAEVTQPSLGVGYEIGRALEHKKAVFCFFRPDSGRNLSAMIKGANGIKVIDYKDQDNLESLIKECLANLKK